MKKAFILLLIVLLLVSCQDKPVDDQEVSEEMITEEKKPAKEETQVALGEKSNIRFKEGKKLELIEIDEAEKDELNKPIEEKIKKHKEEEKKVLEELGDQMTKDMNLRLVVSDGSSRFLVDHLSGNTYLYEKGMETIKDLELNVGQGDEFLGLGLIRKNDVVFYSNNKIQILEKGKTGNYVRGIGLNTDAKIEEIRGNDVLYSLDDTVNLFLIDEDKHLFQYDGQFVGTVDQYVVVRQHNTLFFLDLEKQSFSLIESPTLRKITSTFGSPVLQFQDGTKGFRYYKIKEIDE